MEFRSFISARARAWKFTDMFPLTRQILQDASGNARKKTYGKPSPRVTKGATRRRMVNRSVGASAEYGFTSEMLKLPVIDCTCQHCGVVVKMNRVVPISKDPLHFAIRRPSHRCKVMGKTARLYPPDDVEGDLEERPMKKYPNLSSYGDLSYLFTKRTWQDAMIPLYSSPGWTLYCRWAGCSHNVYNKKDYFDHLVTHLDATGRKFEPGDVWKCKFHDCTYDHTLRATDTHSAFDNLRRNAKRHLLSHADHYEFECRRCLGKFRRIDSYKNHMQRKNCIPAPGYIQRLIAANTITCEWPGCGQRQADTNSYNDHIIEHLRTSKAGYGGRFICKICGLVVRPTHSVAHSNARPFGCDDCGKFFKYSSEIGRHKCTGETEPKTST